MRLCPTVLFPIVLGLADGTCTALVLATQKISTGGVDLWQALRIGIITSGSGFLPLWIAEYAGLRNELVRISRQLNLRSSHSLLRGELGRRSLYGSWAMASLATVSSFFGAAIPLTVALLVPGSLYGPLLAANLSLFVVGLVLASLVQGRRWTWALGLMGIGDVLALVGFKVGLS